MNQTNIKICISYHQKLIADGICCILSQDKKMDVCKLCLNNPVLLEREINIHKPDILLLEAEYIGPHFIELLKILRQKFPVIKMLVVSGSVSHQVLNELLLIVEGYLLRTCEAEKLIFAVNEVRESGKYLCPQLIDILIKKNNNEPGTNHSLTQREKEILILWFNLGHIFKIAEKLHISKTTVRTHLKNIRDKLGKPSSARMIFYACQENQANGNPNPVCPYCKSICVNQS